MKIEVTPNAVTPNGEGTKTNPYQITSLENLLWIGNEAEKNNTTDKFYKLMNNIDASDTYNWNNGAGFRPIGQDYSHSFQGTFDGNKKTITDLYVNHTGGSERLYVGLFGLTSHSTIKNLELKNVNISDAQNMNSRKNGFTCIGGLAGYNYGKITKCTVSGTVAGTNTNQRVYIGGLVGCQYYSTIDKCTVSVTVNGSSASQHICVGGLVGEHQGGKIKDCTSSGTVTGINASTGIDDGTYIGGFSGHNSDGTITNCTASGEVIGLSNNSDARIGGFTGANECDGKITNCMASGNVTITEKNANPKVGSFAGLNSGTITECTASSKVTDAEKSADSHEGNFIGENRIMGNIALWKKSIRLLSFPLNKTI